MTVFMRLVSLILVVAALVFLGADAVSSLERGGELTVRTLDMVWGMLAPDSLLAFKSWIQNHAAFMRREFIPRWRCQPGRRRVFLA